MIGVVDTKRNENVADYVASRNPLAKTHAVWIANNGTELYATNEGASQNDQGTLTKLDAQTGQILWEIPIGKRPSEVLVRKGIAYVSIRNEDAVRVVDVSGDEPVVGPSIPIGTQPTRSSSRTRATRSSSGSAGRRSWP